MKKIRLSKGRFALVDDEDFNILSDFFWHVTPDGYAGRMSSKKDGERRLIRMHAEIMGSKKGHVIDHIDGDKLDNRRSNLRFATKAQNSWNTGLRRKNMTGFKGVSFNSKKITNQFSARIRCNGINEFIGNFSTAEEAFEAYCKRGKEIHGDFFNPLNCNAP